MTATLFGWVTAVFAVTSLVYLVLANAYQTALLAGAAVEAHAHRHLIWQEDRHRLASSPAAPRVSIIAPAYKEEATIAQSTRALLTLGYPELEVVVVNDGSPDATLATLRDEFALVAVPPASEGRLDTQAVRGHWRSPTHPSLVVVDKDNGGKADALNAGLNLASGDLVCAIDADTLIEPDALLRIVRPFLSGEGVVAAGGTIGVANGSEVRDGRVVRPRAPRRWLAGVQAVEYLRAFLFGRVGWNRLGGNLIISGAFGLFRRDAVVAVGGYAHETVGEDMELVAAVRRRGMETGTPGGVAFVADPVAWTEVPETLRVLGRQRDRWHRGLADVLTRHRRLVANPRYGALGTVVMPYFVVVELAGPVVEALGLVGLAGALALGVVNWPFAVIFLLAAYGWGMVLSLTGVALEHAAGTRYPRPADKALLVLWALAENVGYRQLTVWWRVRGLVNHLRGARQWGAMDRRGFAGSPGGRAADGRATG